MPRTGSVTYARIQALSGTTVTLESAYTGAPADTWVYNMDVHNNMAVVRKSRIVGGRRYGLCFRVVRGLVADNECIENSGPAINLTNDAVWASHEGLFGQHVKILRNTFQGQNFDAAAWREREGVVEVAVQAYDGSHGVEALSRSLQDVSVCDNTFVDWQIAGVRLLNTSGGLVGGNVFRNTMGLFYTTPNFMIDIGQCEDIAGTDNQDADSRNVTQNLQVQESDRVSVTFQ